MKDLRNHQICSRCVMDMTIPDIKFDENGVCQYCHIHDNLMEIYGREGKNNHFDMIIKMIKKKGNGKEYDCIVSVSGGREVLILFIKQSSLGFVPLLYISIIDGNPISRLAI